MVYGRKFEDRPDGRLAASLLPHIEKLESKRRKRFNPFEQSQLFTQLFEELHSKVFTGKIPNEKARLKKLRERLRIHIFDGVDRDDDKDWPAAAYCTEFEIYLRPAFMAAKPYAKIAYLEHELVHIFQFLLLGQKEKNEHWKAMYDPKYNYWRDRFEIEAHRIEFLFYVRNALVRGAIKNRTDMVEYLYRVTGMSLGSFTKRDRTAMIDYLEKEIFWHKAKKRLLKKRQR